MKTASSDLLLTSGQGTQGSAQAMLSMLTRATRHGLPLPPDLAFYANIVTALVQSELIQQGKAFVDIDPGTGERRFCYRKKAQRRKRPGVDLCGATTRRGTTCQCLPEEGKRRCRFHGGKSTGPRTIEGRAAIAESNRRRVKSRS